MRIGELAELAGVSTRSLRYYEAQGLLRARRAANGYREYGDGDLRMVRENGVAISHRERPGDVPTHGHARPGGGEELARPDRLWPS